MIKTKILSIVADIARLNASEISPDSSLKKIGIDSLQTVELREAIERSFNAYIKDDFWFDLTSDGKNLQDIIEFLACHERDIVGSDRSPTTFPNDVGVKENSQTSLLPNGLITSTIDIGMPLTGRNKLAEGPLLQLLGDLRWTHMCRLAGVKSKNIIDEQGNRLYPTFFNVDIAFPANYPMAHFGENDKFHVIGDLKRFGTSMLDGYFYLFPEGVLPDEQICHAAQDEVLRRGIAIVRLSNIFVMQFNGAEWLKKARPANPGFKQIPETFEPPSSYEWMKSAEKEVTSPAIPSNFVRLTEQPVYFEYNLVPDRDLNAAGLVYFANYPVFLDICERKYLETTQYTFDDDLINARTLVSRRSAYLNNASAKNILDIEISAFIENPFMTGCKNPELAPIRLLFHYRMYRRSDKRLMMVSIAEKVIYDKFAEDLLFYEKLGLMSAVSA